MPGDFVGHGSRFNLALAGAADLAEALVSGQGWAAVAWYEAEMAARARPAAEEAHFGAEVTLSPQGTAPVVARYRPRPERAMAAA